MKSRDGHAFTTSPIGLRFSPMEAVIGLTTAASVIGLQLQPIIASPALPAIHAALFFVAFRTPTSAFLILSAISYLPFQSTVPAEIGAVVALPALFFWTRRLPFKDLGATLFIALFFVFVATMTGRFEALQGDPSRVLFYAALAIVASNSFQGELQKCLLGLSVGCLLVAAPYWMGLAGLPVEINDWGSERAGMARAGGVRADAVLTWPPLLMGLGGIFGLALLSLKSNGRGLFESNLNTISLLAATWAMPPLIATLCNSAIAAALFMFAALVCLAARARPTTDIGRRSLVRFRASLAVFIAAGIIAVASNALEMRDKIDALNENYSVQSEELGAAASRTEVWSCAVESIVLYPLTGAAFVGGEEPLPTLYQSKGYYLSHNVFLDYGRYAGIPGLMFALFLFFLPIARLLRNGERKFRTPYLLFLLGALLFWSVLSFQFYKTVWVFWGLTWVAGSPSSHPRRWRTMPC